MPIRTNLVPNPSFEVNLDGWISDNSTLPTRDTTKSHSGSASIKYVASAGLMTLGGTYAIPVKPNTPYRFSCYAMGDAANHIALRVRWLDAAGATISDVSPLFTQVNTTTWTRIAVTNAGYTSPSNAAFVQLRPAANTHGTYWFDSFQVEEGSALGDYFDGSSANTVDAQHAWTGTPHQSASTATSPRRNLIPNPSFETNLSSWSLIRGGASVTLTRETNPSWKHSGTSALKVAATAAVSDVEISTPIGTAGFPVTGGKPYSLSTYLTVSVDAGFRVYLNFYSSTGSLVGGPYSTVYPGVNAGSRVFRINEIAPANAVYAAAAIRWSGSMPAGANFLMDGVLFEQSAELGDYFDGSSVKSGFNYAWSGTPHDSSSTETVGAVVPVSPSYTSAYSGEGTLSSALVRSRKLTSDFSGEGTLSTTLTRNQKLTSDFSGEGTLSSTLDTETRLTSEFSGEGTLTSTLTITRTLNSNYTGTGTLSSSLTPTRPAVVFESDFSGEGVLITDLSYVERPEDRSFIGKLSTYSVTQAATPLNPANGSNSLPSMNATFVGGIDPEYSMGATLEFESTRVGSHYGEVSSVSTSSASDRANLSVESPLTLLNADRRVYPLIQSESTWFPARAIDYWTQQCGLFYDRVPGEVTVYASGFGHGLAYLRGHEDERFYSDKSAGTIAVNGRSVKLFGTDTTATTKLVLNNSEEANMAFTLGQRLVFSVGVGIDGLGRSVHTAWQFHNEFGTYVVTITADSDGDVSVKLSQPNGPTVVTHNTTVSSGSAYRLTLSVEKLTETSLGATFTVDSDNLMGEGSRVFTGSRNIVGFPLPRTATLDSVKHVSLGIGSGAEMYYYGTYLATMLSHPQSLPQVTKVLGQSSKPAKFVSGFAGNMWDMLNQYAAISRLDVSYVDSQLVVKPRNKAVTYGAKLSGMSRRASRRDRYQKVALLNQNSVASLNKDNLLWRADSVYQVTTGEVFETTIQTEHSILELSQPKCVTGIEPFPYKSGAGQYVVTGADGYICSPRFWREQGGKVEVELTDKEGEFLIRITGPNKHHESRSPYRISEGAGDRPALYVTGSGVLNKPEQHEISTGARNAKEGYDSVFESPFLSGLEAVYDTASEMAREYSASNAEYSFNEPNQHGNPSLFGTHPPSARLESECGILRISGATITKENLSADAVPQTTIADYKANLPVGSKIRDEKAKYRGMTIRELNIKPLKGR